MKRNSLDNCDGFTYLTALMVVVIMGIMLGGVGQSWKMLMQREREEELLYRGQQIREAIKAWNTPGKGRVVTPLNDLKDLLQDPRSLTTIRYLRRLYPDPITGKEWTILRTPNRGIIGVASTSQDPPLKVGGFPDELKDFAGKKQYNEWAFFYDPAGPAGSSGTPGLPGTTGTTGPGGRSGDAMRGKAH